MTAGSTHKTGMRDQQAELFEMLAEEAGEIVQATMKLLRHGPHRYNPDDPQAGSNATQLAVEIGQLNGIAELLVNSGSLDHYTLVQSQAERVRKVRGGHAYTHYQNKPTEG